MYGSGEAGFAEAGFAEAGGAGHSQWRDETDPAGTYTAIEDDTALVGLAISGKAESAKTTTLHSTWTDEE